AITNEVCGHVQFHPPALEGRYQGLNLVGITSNRIPDQKHHYRCDDQQHEAAQGTCGVATFVIQVEQGRDDGKQHEHFVQVADRNVADIWTQEMAFAPAHQ